ncbi:formylmethanofuran dehydrogenase subunit C [Rubripirellula amarantea]|nr:formylmethanofuran dehydrogenase subunit C [Rubripirellula amarantea]
MKTILLRQKQIPNFRIDASSLSLAKLSAFSDKEIASLPMGQDGQCIDDWFEVQCTDSDQSVLRMEGDFANFDRIGASHERGLIVVVGSVGNGLGCSMSGGEIIVEGSAGNAVAGAVDGQRKGMTGGRIEIAGDAGNQVGYRMRRGEVFVAGNAGHFLASHMLAGTIVAVGQFGTNVGYGMRRGTVILSKSPNLSSPRFSEPIKSELTWLSLVKNPSHQMTRELMQDIAANRGQDVVSRRGDGAVGGQGEIISRSL